jgi:hypothetical protein
VDFRHVGTVLLRRINVLAAIEIQTRAVVIGTPPARGRGQAAPGGDAPAMP